MQLRCWHPWGPPHTALGVRGGQALKGNALSSVLNPGQFLLTPTACEAVELLWGSVAPYLLHAQACPFFRKNSCSASLPGTWQVMLSLDTVHQVV